MTERDKGKDKESEAENQSVYEKEKIRGRRREREKDMEGTELEREHQEVRMVVPEAFIGTDDPKSKRHRRRMVRRRSTGETRKRKHNTASGLGEKSSEPQPIVDGNTTPNRAKRANFYRSLSNERDNSDDGTPNDAVTTSGRSSSHKTLSPTNSLRKRRGKNEDESNEDQRSNSCSTTPRSKSKKRSKSEDGDDNGTRSEAGAKSPEKNEKKILQSLKNNNTLKKSRGKFSRRTSLECDLDINANYTNVNIGKKQEGFNFSPFKQEEYNESDEYHRIQRYPSSNTSTSTAEAEQSEETPDNTTKKDQVESPKRIVLELEMRYWTAFGYYRSLRSDDLDDPNEDRHDEPMDITNFVVFQAILSQDLLQRIKR